ncbi:MAG: acyl-CoA dehydrogenase [Betaproteobacteria bacterium]|nr:acyl-CoA dehydrogenase [Betaproteobacteria bacterium]
MGLAHLAWPFFDPAHRELAQQLAQWTAQQPAHEDHLGTDEQCRTWVRRLGQAGWLRHVVALEPGGASSSTAHTRLDTRTICLLRETLAQHDGLADFALAMQGLGSGAISLYGTPEQRQQWLPDVALGQCITAFALSESQAGSDVAAMQCRAEETPNEVVLNGEKTWISNGGIADLYVVFARSRPMNAAASAKASSGISAYLVPANTPGLRIAERIQVMAPHPLARLQLEDCRLPIENRLGQGGQGFKIAMQTLDVFRTSVAAAGLGFARRALAEGLQRARSRAMFGATLAQQPLAQAKLADMAMQVDAAALLTYRAAWMRDQGQSVTMEAAMAKLTATENAQRVIDSAVQLWGGLGVVSGQTVERLYREIRALRIYEGASEVQQLIIGRELLRAAS